MSQPTPLTEDIQVLLMGGPASIPEASRRQQVSPVTEKIKVPHMGGYEHFIRSDEPAPGEAVVYRWQTRTSIAE